MLDNPFKPGDVVQCAMDGALCNCLVIGQKYVVNDVTEATVWVDGVVGDHQYKRFNLISHAPVGGAVVNTREQLLHDWELSDPPTADEIRLYLKDPEIDWTPAEMVESIRRIATRIMGTHRGCAGCTTCTEHGVLNTAADSFDVALAIIESFPSVSPATAWDEGHKVGQQYERESTMTSETAWRKAIADQVRRNCTPSSEAYAKGGDTLIYEVADWIENPPEWSTFHAPDDKPDVLMPPETLRERLAADARLWKLAVEVGAGIRAAVSTSTESEK